jgi:hypothetical protein
MFREQYRSGSLDLDDASRDLLYYVAGLENIPGRSRMRKQELVVALRQHREALGASG